MTRRTGRQLDLFAAPEKPKPSPRWWSTEGGAMARVCPSCGCGKETPCRTGRGNVPCVPAGLFGQRVCSACASRDA